MNQFVESYFKRSQYLDNQYLKTYIASITVGASCRKLRVELYELGSAKWFFIMTKDSFL